MPSIEHFLVGCAGAAVAYGYTQRLGRIEDVWRKRKYAIRRVAFDVLLYVSSGGAVATWVIRPEMAGGAFLAGAGWETLFNRVLPDRRFPKPPNPGDEEELDEQV